MSVIININLNAHKRKADETELYQLGPEVFNVKGRPKRAKTDAKKVITNSIPLRKSNPGQVYMVCTGDPSQLRTSDDIFELEEPKLVESLPNNIVDIVCGTMHTLALTQDGKLYSWGCNDENSLGRAGEESVPAIVEFPETINIVQIVASDSMSAVLTSKGQVYAWGGIKNNSGLMGFYNMDKLQKTPKLIQGSILKDPVAHLGTISNGVLVVTTKGLILNFGVNTCGLSRLLKTVPLKEVLNPRQELSFGYLPLGKVTSFFGLVDDRYLLNLTQNFYQRGQQYHHVDCFRTKENFSCGTGLFGRVDYAKLVGSFSRLRI